MEHLANPQILNNSDPHILRPSREALKRKMEQLQSVGRAMIELPPGKFNKLVLPEPLHIAIVEARRLTSKEARRRQLQFVGSIMEQFEATDFARQLRDIDHQRSVEKTARASEQKEKARWLLSLEDHEFYDQFNKKLTSDEFQRVRQLIRAAKKQIATGKSVDEATKELLNIGIPDYSH